MIVPLTDRARMPLLDPKLDVVFKMLLLRDESLLRSMIEAVLTLPGPIESLEVLNPEILREAPDDKSVSLDVRVSIANIGKIDIEMQTRMLPGTTERFLYYWAREFATGLAPGEDYTSLNPVYSILWLGENIHHDTPFHSRYMIREPLTGKPFCEHLQIHALELRKIPQMAADDLSAVLDWGRFLTGTDEERKLLAARNPIMKTATDQLERLSNDPTAQRIAWERDRNERAHHHLIGASIEAGRKQGLEEGRREEKVAILSRQLARKFGALTPEQQARVQTADDALLNRWSDGIFDAETIDALLAP